jgi:hypothetical protein
MGSGQAGEPMPGELDPRTWLSFEEPGSGERDWVKLYLVALAVLIPTAIFGWFTLFPLTLLVTLIANGHGNLGLANVLPWIVVGGYFAWATSALIHPLGAGRYLAEGIGARRPTAEETDAYRDATSSLPLDGVKRLPRWLYVLDRHELNAAVVGDVIIINRTVFDSEYLAAVIAHELGHLNSMDVHVSCAANRLASLARSTEPWRTGTSEARRSGQQLGCLWGLRHDHRPRLLRRTANENDGAGLGELVAPTRIRRRRLRRPPRTRRRPRQIP